MGIKNVQRWLDKQKFDVIVAGGGPAGLGAAVAVTNNGANVLLVEQRAFLGGVAPLGLWMPINNALLAKTGEPRGGLPSLLIKKLERFGPVAMRLQEHEIAGEEFLGLIAHPEYLKVALFEILEENHVSCLLHTKVVDVLKDNNEVQGIVLEGKSGRVHQMPVNAKVVVDATGDADVSVLAGVEWKQGREGDGFVAPMTLLFAIGNVDTACFEDFRRQGGDLKTILKQGISEGYIVPESANIDRGTLPGIISVNSAGTKALGSLDGTDVLDLTRAERHGRSQAIDFVRLMRDKAVPGLECCYLLFVAPEIAVRETRRIVGEYTLTEKDIREGTRFEDVIARRYGILDIGFVWYDQMASPHDVPYRSLIPKTINNLLVAGRSISATFMGTQAGRCMGNQMMVGMGAGTAAALSVRHNVPLRKVNIQELQNLLLKQGSDLDLPEKKAI